MTDDKLISIDIGALSKPADTLIKKLSSAVGGLFRPLQIKRIAKAEAEASLIRANTEIEINDMRHKYAMYRFLEEQALQQDNMEKITAKALPQLQEGADPNKMENDWITNFFAKSRIVSDEQMQELWSSVLAGEANAPGTYSKRTVNFLSDIDKKDAELFQSLCRFGWIVGTFTPVIFEPNDNIYVNLGLGFNALTHLDSIGLIRFSDLSGFHKIGLPKHFAISYCNQRLVLEMEKEQNNELSIGKVLLTKVGEELSRVVQTSGVEGFYDYAKGKWARHIPKTSTNEQ